MMNLNKLLSPIEVLQHWGETTVDVAGIFVDSRQVLPQSLFFAVDGATTDGHQFIPSAIENGAVVIVSEKKPIDSFENWAGTWVQVADIRYAIAHMAETYYDFPSRKLKLVGVTGTNGKSTVATLLYQLFTQLGYKVGLFSTIENRIHDQILPSALTTPDPISLSRILADMVKAGCDYAFMEVSSHALSQQRTAALDFDGAVFMNISHDHLDYHQTFDRYIAAKKLFFDGLSDRAFALINKDDSRSKVMVQNSAARILTFTVKSLADYKVQILESDVQMMLLNINGHQLYTSITGDYNAYNLVAVYGVAIQLGQTTEEVLPALSGLKGVSGRLQKIHMSDRHPTAFVDYAHTPDALSNVCRTLKGLLEGKGRLIVVVGCGGDRDKSKRPLMAQIAADLGAVAILTSDNPRSEDPQQIIQEMLVGLDPVQKAKTFSLADRREAIRMAIAMAQEEDVVLVAGKGHEKYQIIGQEKHVFDDVAEVEKALSEKFIKI